MDHSAIPESPVLTVGRKAQVIAAHRGRLLGLYGHERAVQWENVTTFFCLLGLHEWQVADHVVADFPRLLEECAEDYLRFDFSSSAHPPRLKFAVFDRCDVLLALSPHPTESRREETLPVISFFGFVDYTVGGQSVPPKLLDTTGISREIRQVLQLRDVVMSCFRGPLITDSQAAALPAGLRALRQPAVNMYLH